MAYFKKIIPFILHFEAGVAPKFLSLPAPQIFDLAKKTGLANDPDDTGGLTQCGVTYSTYSSYCKIKKKAATTSGLVNLQLSEWLDILKTMFWDKWQADKIEDQGLAHLLVDWVWISGPASIKAAQQVLGVEADGVVGPKTLAAINNADPAQLFANLKARREVYYRSCKTAWKYLPGWLRRLNAIRQDGKFLIYDEIYG